MEKHIKKFNENTEEEVQSTEDSGRVNLAGAMENRKISDLTVRELKEIITRIVSMELSKRIGN